MEQLYEVGIPDMARNRLPGLLKKRTSRTRRNRKKTAHERHPQLYAKTKKDEFARRKAGMKHVVRSTAVSSIATGGVMKASDAVTRAVQKHDNKKADKDANKFRKQFLGEGMWGVAAKAGIGAAKHFAKDVAKEAAVSGTMHAGTKVITRHLDKRDSRNREERYRINAGKNIEKHKRGKEAVGQKPNTLSSQMTEGKAFSAIKKHGKSTAMMAAFETVPTLMQRKLQKGMNADHEKAKERHINNQVKKALDNKSGVTEAKERDHGARIACLKAMGFPGVTAAKSNPTLKRGVKLGGEKTKSSPKAEEIVFLRTQEIAEALNSLGGIGSIAPNKDIQGLNATLGPKAQNAAAAAKSRTAASTMSNKIRSSR